MPPGDEALFRFINGLAGRWPAADWLVRGIASDYLVPVVMGLALLGLWFSPQGVRRARQWGAMNAVLATGLVNAAVKATNLVFFRPRPFQDGPVNLLFYPPHDSSFPSNITAIAWAVALSLFLHDRRTGLLLAIPALLVAWGRVMAGVHYPSDAVGGIAYGLASAYAAHWLLVWLAPLPRFILRVAMRLYLA